MPDQQWYVLLQKCTKLSCDVPLSSAGHMLYVSASCLCTARPTAYVAGKAGGTASTQDAKAKKRQRQESDDEESGCTLSDHERTTGMFTSIACLSFLMININFI